DDLLYSAARDAARDQAHLGAQQSCDRSPESGFRARPLRVQPAGIGEGGGHQFHAHAPKLDAKLDHIMPQVAAMGAAVSVVDFDRDGWQDIYIINSGEGTKNALY